MTLVHTSGSPPQRTGGNQDPVGALPGVPIRNNMAGCWLSNIRRNLQKPDASGFSLRYNQINAVQRLIDFLEAGGGESLRGRFKQPTGAGKTVLFGVITKLIDRPTLVLVPRQNLLSNTKDELVDIVGIPSDDIGLVGGGYLELGRKITIATYQSHVSRMGEDTNYQRHVQSCELIVCDEAHRSLGERTSQSIESLDVQEDAGQISNKGAYSDDTTGDDQELTIQEEEIQDVAFRELDRSTNRQCLKLAFTATEKLACKDVADHFPDLIAEEKQGDLVKAKILVGYKIVQAHAVVETNDFEGYFSEEQEAAVLQRENVYAKLSEEYSRVLSAYRLAENAAAYPLRGVAFCVNIAECDKFAAAAAQLGLRTQIVTSREARGRSGDAVIKKAEQALLKQEIDLIVTVNKLGEGWNFRPANAAIWARASMSPMVVIQGVGRTCRSYTDEEGREKPYSFVFETEWSRRAAPSGKRNRPDNIVRRKPLTIAQALALNGENPEEVCAMANGTSLKIDKFELLKSDGTALVDGIEYVEPIRYICDKRPFLTNYAAETLLGFFGKVRPVKPACPVVSSGRIVTCYLKSEIDKVLEESIYVSSDGIVNIPRGASDKSEESVSIQCVYAPLYLEDKVNDPELWISSADSIGLAEIQLSDLKVLYRPEGARQRTIEVALYLKSEVDKLLEDTAIPGTSVATRLSLAVEQLENGVEIDLGNGYTRTAIHVASSSAIPHGIRSQVVAEMRRRRIRPIEQVVYGTNSRPVTLHWNEDIQPIVKAIADQQKTEREARLKLKRDPIVARARAEAERRQTAKENTEKIITPLNADGLFHVRYKLTVSRGTKTLQGEGQAVDVQRYAPEALGRRLTDEEQRIVTRGLRNLPTMNLYWQKEVDTAVQELQ
jgi:superfamily II DNA or RNA helicase